MYNYNQYNYDYTKFQRQKRRINLDNIDSKEILENLKEKFEYINLDIKNKYYIIFAKSFKERIKEDNLYLFDLKDLENIMYQI